MRAALRRQIIWSRQDEDTKATFERNKALKDSIVGPEVILDTSQAYVLSVYLDLRREAGAERGIKLPENAPPLLCSHLRALEDEFSKERSRGLEEMKHKKAARPSAPERHFTRRR